MPDQRLPNPYRSESRIVTQCLESLNQALDWLALSRVATPWVQAVRDNPPPFWAMESLLKEYPISSAEGLALMRLAEGLLRVPDAGTALALTADQLGRADFEGSSDKVLSRLSSTRIAMSKQFLPATPGGAATSEPGLIAKLGERTVVAATLRAVQLVGRQFVLGQTMTEGMAEAAAATVVHAPPDPTPSPGPVTCEPVNAAEALLQAMAAIFADETTPSEPLPSVEASDAERVEAALSFEPDAEAAPSPSMAPPAVEPFCSPPTPEVVEAAVEPEPAQTLPPSEAVTIDPPAKKTHPPLAPNAASEWRRWVGELESTRGPKPLAVIERTFVSAYVPLTDALARGVAGEEAEPVALAWAKSFAKSYSEAFDALRVRGKRPTMVLDVPDLALRIGRLHGARSAQLVLVDGMRFDLGVRVNERLKSLLGQHAALTERLLLWSALPSTTAMQLELIGRGAQGLKEVTEQTDSEIPVARGRSAATLRRIRAGQREVLKLDLVESAMSVPGGPLAERLDDLADEAAEALAAHLLRLPPRTLAVVFGDHGFTLDQVGGGTSAGHSGGASPEEVLVPAFAWLVGAVH